VPLEDGAISVPRHGHGDHLGDARTDERYISCRSRASACTSSRRTAEARYDADHGHSPPSPRPAKGHDIRGTTDHATRNPINSTTAKALSRQRLTAMTSRTRKWRNWQTRRIQDPVG